MDLPSSWKATNPLFPHRLTGFYGCHFGSRYTCAYLLLYCFIPSPTDLWADWWFLCEAVTSWGNKQAYVYCCLYSTMSDFLCFLPLLIASQWPVVLWHDLWHFSQLTTSKWERGESILPLPYSPLMIRLGKGASTLLVCTPRESVGGAGFLH